MRWWIGVVMVVLVGTIAVTSLAYIVVGHDTGASTTSSPAATTRAPTTTSPAVSPSPTSVAVTSNTTTTTAVVATYTLAVIEQHASSTSCWLLIDRRVYDVTTYLRSHPGGSRTITPWCGKEATTAFASEDGRGEHSSSAYDLLADYEIGTLAA